MKLCCGITLYNPNQEEINNIYKYSQIFDYIYIYDNTDSNTNIDNSKYFIDSKYKYISYSNNNGLSIAYNDMCSRALDDGYNYIMLLDQDSDVSNDDIVKIYNYIYKNIDDNIAVYGMDIIFDHESNRKRQNLDEKNYIEEVNWVISSGSIINLNTYKNIGGFDENYFIDRVDYDYCMQARKKGYKIAVVKGCYLKQPLGDIKVILGKKFSTHSSIRHYYSFRNRLYYYLVKNNTNLNMITKCVFYSIRSVLYVIFIEDKKLDKFKMIIKSIRDFSNSKMGKLNDKFY